MHVSVTAGSTTTLSYAHLSLNYLGEDAQITSARLDLTVTTNRPPPRVPCTRPTTSAPTRRSSKLACLRINSRRRSTRPTRPPTTVPRGPATGKVRKDGTWDFDLTQAAPVLASQRQHRARVRARHRRLPGVVGGVLPKTASVSKRCTRFRTDSRRRPPQAAPAVPRPTRRRRRRSQRAGLSKPSPPLLHPRRPKRRRLRLRRWPRHPITEAVSTVAPRPDPVRSTRGRW